jgi:hypothetical protein
MDEMTKAVLAAWRDRFPNNAYARPGAPESFAAEAVRVTLAAPPPSTQKVREALIPFASAFDGLPPNLPDDLEILLKLGTAPFARITVGEFRAAHAALSTNPGEQKTTTAEGQT